MTFQSSPTPGKMSQKQIFNDKMILNFLRLRHPVTMFPILPNADSGSASPKSNVGGGRRKVFDSKSFISSFFLRLLFYIRGDQNVKEGWVQNSEWNGTEGKESAKWSELHQKRVCRFDGVQNRFTELKANEGSKNSDEDFSRETVSKSVQN